MLALIGLAFLGRETPQNPGPYTPQPRHPQKAGHHRHNLMPEPPFFSVIIPTCNRPQTLAQCLRKLETQTPQAKFHFETLVGDDSPDTRTRDLLAQHHPRVIWVKGPRKGPPPTATKPRAKPRGRGSSSSTTTPSPNPPSLKATTPWPKQAPHKILEGRLACPDKRNSPFYRMPENLQGGLFTSGNIAFEKETFEQLGGFDEDLVVMEDLEIGHRIRTRGIPHTFCAGRAHTTGPRNSDWATCSGGPSTTAGVSSTTTRLRPNHYPCPYPPPFSIP